jgi:hypothetical protein
VKVIYIAGQAFSGSTVLCALLGVHPQMEPVSELSMRSLKAAAWDRTCSCGRPSKECPFWMAVNRDWMGAMGAMTVSRYAELQRRIETIRYTWPRMFSHRAWPGAQEMQAYTEATVALFQSVVRAGGRPIVIDSSKKPGRAIALAGMKGLDVSIVHLVRSGLNYVDSNIRRGVLSRDDPAFLYRVFRLGTKWSTANFAAERAAIMNRPKGVTVRFEDLMADPVAALRHIETSLGVDLRSIRDHLEAGQPVPWRHMDSGSRHRHSGPTPLRVGLASGPALPRPVRLAFYLGGGAMSRHFGYL